MRKFRSLIAAFLVVLIQITPGPLGLRPAHAAVPLAVVAVGAVIAASGVMVAGAGVYKPPTFAQANAAVDSMTGDINRKVVVARSFAEGVSGGLRGYIGQYTLDYDNIVDWVTANPIDFPTLFGPVSASLVQQPPVIAPGFVYTYGGSGNFTLDSKLYGPILKLNQTDPTAAYPISLGGNARAVTFYWAGVWQTNIVENIKEDSPGSFSYIYSEWTALSTLLPVKPLPVTRNPPAFAAAFPNTEAGQDETDKIAAQNPAAIKSAPMPMTLDQIGDAIKQIEREIAQGEVDRLQPIADSHPEDPLVIAELEKAKTRLQEAELAAEHERAKLETQEDTPDIPYNPSGLGGPYTLPEVDFGQRLQQFIDSAKASSIFSLPGTIFGNIPGAGSSTITIQGGQIFGTHTFDFADMAGMWVVLRGIVLTGFGIAAVRVVAIKGGSE